MGTNNLADLNKLVNLFRPVYYFHTAERFYPCNLGDFISHCSLGYKGEDGKVEEIIPHPRLNSRTIRADKDALAESGIKLADIHIHNLSWKTVDFSDSPDASKYCYIEQRNEYILKLVNKAILPGNLTGGATGTATYFDTQIRSGNEKTSYENGFPFFPEYWVHRDPAICQTRANQTLRANKEIVFTPNPQYCHISKRLVNGEHYTDLIYTTFLAFNGSISIIPGVGTHLIDIEVVGIRFKGENVSESIVPFRCYFAEHGGYSWYEPKDCEFMAMEGQDGLKSNHLIVYFGRESHEAYPKPGVWQRIFGIANDLCNQGVLWKPPAVYLSHPTKDVLNTSNNDFTKAQKDVVKKTIMLIPKDDGDRGPDWYYFVTQGTLPGFDRAKLELRESASDKTSKKASEREMGTFIDKAVPTSLEFIGTRDNGSRQGEIHDGNTSKTPSTGKLVLERTFLSTEEPSGKDLMDIVKQMILPTQSAGHKLVYNMLSNMTTIVDAYQPGWGSQSAGPYGVDGEHYPIWYHKENMLFFDLQVWLHSTKSLEALHPGDDKKGYPGGIGCVGLEHLVIELLSKHSSNNSIMFKASLEQGKTIKLTANAEIRTKKNRGGFELSHPHAFCSINIDKLELEIECKVNMPVAISDKGVTRFCINEDGDHTPEPTATGWFVPNIQWPHNDRFQGCVDASEHCKGGLPPDAVMNKDEFAKVMNGTCSINLVDRKFNTDVEFIGFMGGHSDAAKEFAKLLQCGSVGRLLSLVLALCGDLVPWYYPSTWVFRKIADLFGRVAPLKPAPIELIFGAVKNKLESMVADKITSFFNDPPKL